MSNRLIVRGISYVFMALSGCYGMDIPRGNEEGKKNQLLLVNMKLPITVVNCGS